MPFNNSIKLKANEQQSIQRVIDSEKWSIGDNESRKLVKQSSW